MVKHIALATALSLALMAPVVSAQTAAVNGRNPQIRRPGLHLVLGLFRLRIQYGVRTGRITPAELAKLRADIAAFGAEARAIRQSGEPPTAETRQHLRQQLRRISREIYLANHNRINGSTWR